MRTSVRRSISASSMQGTPLPARKDAVRSQGLHRLERRPAGQRRRRRACSLPAGLPRTAISTISRGTTSFMVGRAVAKARFASSKAAHRCRPKIFGCNATSAGFAQHGAGFRQGGPGQPAGLPRAPSAPRSIRRQLPGAGARRSSRCDEQLVPDHALGVGHPPDARSRSRSSSQDGWDYFADLGIRGRSRSHRQDAEEDRRASRHRQALAQGHLGRRSSDQSRHRRRRCHRMPTSRDRNGTCSPIRIRRPTGRIF